MEFFDKDQLIEILKLPFKIRSPQQILLISQQICHLKYFKNLTERISSKNFALCCKHLEYVQLRRGQAVYHRGAKPKDFFVILSGQIQGLTPKTYEAMNMQRENKKNYSAMIDNKINDIDYNSNALKELSKIFIDEVGGQFTIADLHEPQLFYEEGVFKYNRSDLLGMGRKFGEISLVLKQGRKATVLCLSDCEFVILKKEYFDLYLSDVLHKKILDRAHLIVKASKLNLSYESMIQFSNSFSKVKLKIGDTIFKKGDPSIQIYIIKKGEVQLILPQNKELLNNAFLVERVQLKKDTKSIFRIKDFEMRLAILCPGFMLGHEDALEQKSRIYNAQISTASATLYYIDFQVFRYYLNEQDQEKLDLFQEQLKESQQQINQQKERADMVKVKSDKAVYGQKNIKRSGLIRSTVEDIEVYSRNGSMDISSNRISQRKINVTYGAQLIEKLEKIQWVKNNIPRSKPLGNDEYMQAMERVGIENPMKKFPIRIRIPKDHQKRTIPTQTSTSDKIRIQRSTQYGTNKKHLSNKSWGQILSHQYNERTKLDIPTYSQQTTKSQINSCKSQPSAHGHTQQDVQQVPRIYSAFSNRDGLNIDFSIERKKGQIHNSLYDNCCSKTATKKESRINCLVISEIESENQVFKFTQNDNKMNFNFEQQIITKQYSRPKTSQLRQMTKSIHNIFRFGSPRDVQERLLMKRFQ